MYCVDDLLLFFFLMIRRPPRSTLFPYTTPLPICKVRRPGKVVATFCLGTQRLHDFLDANPAIELLPVDWVNDPRIIAQEPKDRKSTRLNSSHANISYAVFCLKKKQKQKETHPPTI